tara:strand:+ start:2013 stop:2837 length:825 start_codon:yes stop_codon:yes gene_type:complete
MANWYVTSNTFGAVTDVAEDAQTVTLSISNIDPDTDVWSGVYIKKENFKIGGATESPDNTWTGGNVDSPVAKVVFTNDPADNSLADLVNNKVTATVYLNSHTFSTAGTVYVDIDTSSTAPALHAIKPFCLRTIFTLSDTTLSSNHTVTNVNISGVTEATETSEVTGQTIFKNSGNIEIGVSTLVSQVTFVAGNNYEYTELPSFNISAGGGYFAAFASQLAASIYTASITDEVTNAAGQYTRFTLNVHANISPSTYYFMSPNTSCSANHQVEFTL